MRARSADAAAAGPRAAGAWCRCAAAAVALALLCCATAAGAENIYKCKGPDGRITYSGVPCAGDGARLGAPEAAAGAAVSVAPAGRPAAAEEATAGGASSGKGCDNAAALRGVTTRLASPNTPDDVREFLGHERLRVLRCEIARLTEDERRARDAAMRELDTWDPAARRAAEARIDALYDRYLTADERAVRARERAR